MVAVSSKVFLTRMNVEGNYIRPPVSLLFPSLSLFWNKEREGNKETISLLFYTISQISHARLLNIIVLIDSLKLLYYKSKPCNQDNHSVLQQPFCFYSDIYIQDL